MSRLMKQSHNKRKLHINTKGLQDKACVNGKVDPLEIVPEIEI